MCRVSNSRLNAAVALFLQAKLAEAEAKLAAENEASAATRAENDSMKTKLSKVRCGGTAADQTRDRESWNPPLLFHLCSQVMEWRKEVQKKMDEMAKQKVKSHTDKIP